MQPNGRQAHEEQAQATEHANELDFRTNLCLLHFWFRLLLGSRARGIFICFGGLFLFLLQFIDVVDVLKHCREKIAQQRRKHWIHKHTIRDEPSLTHQDIKVVACVQLLINLIVHSKKSLYHTHETSHSMRFIGSCFDATLALAI